jgi:hypothetical protein
MAIAPQQQQSDWPSTLVAVAILLLIGAIAITAIIHYSTVDDALKIWTGLTALVGVVTGAFVSYFFTKGTTQAAQQTAQVAAQTVQVASQAAQQAQAVAETKDKALSATLALITDPALQAQVMNHPAVAAALNP